MVSLVEEESYCFQLLTLFKDCFPLFKVCGHLLREGCLKSAALLAEEGNISSLIDSNIFKAAGKIVEGLRSHDCSLALEWCSENASKLKKVMPCIPRMPVCFSLLVAVLSDSHTPSTLICSRPSNSTCICKSL